MTKLLSIGKGKRSGGLLTIYVSTARGVPYSATGFAVNVNVFVRGVGIEVHIIRFLK